MVKEYMTSEGNIAQYDTASKLIVVYNGEREVIDGPRPAFPDDLVDYHNAYPEESPEQTAEKNSLVATLTGALVEVRNITSDQQVTAEELASTLPTVTLALEAYRDYDGPHSLTIDKLVNLLIAQSVLSIQILVSNAYTGLSTISTDFFNLNLYTETLRAEYDQHITDNHS